MPATRTIPAERFGGPRSEGQVGHERRLSFRAAGLAFAGEAKASSDFMVSERRSPHRRRERSGGPSDPSKCRLVGHASQDDVCATPFLPPALICTYQFVDSRCQVLRSNTQAGEQSQCRVTPDRRAVGNLGRIKRSLGYRQRRCANASENKRPQLPRVRLPNVLRRTTTFPATASTGRLTDLVRRVRSGWNGCHRKRPRTASARPSVRPA